MFQAGWNAVYIQQCKAHWSEVYQADDSSLVVSDILMWAQVGLVSILGSFLLFAILHFEQFGGDVQKRSLGNRLASHGAANAWLQTITRSLLIITVRYDLISFQLFFLKLILSNLHAMLIYIGKV